MYENAKQMIELSKKVIVIQAENPDGDSLGSALALEEILGDLGKKVVLCCPVEIPKYMRYINGWDRVVNDFDNSADLAIIVDTTADVLLTKVLETPGIRHFLDTNPVLVIDHHNTESNLSFILALNNITAAVIFIVFFILYQQLEANYISPGIQSKRINLSALAILVAVTVGIYMFGIIGGIISIPIAGCIKVLVDDHMARAKKSSPSHS